MADVVWPLVDSMGFVFMNFWLLSYAMALFGSVSFGYLVMRFGLPDTRGLSRQIKLGLAGAAGLLIFVVSFIVSAFFSPEYIYVFMPAITGFALLALQARSMFFSPKMMRVAIPVARVDQPKEEKKQPKELEYLIPKIYSSKSIGDVFKKAEKVEEKPDLFKLPDAPITQKAESKPVFSFLKREEKEEAAEPAKKEIIIMRKEEPKAEEVVQPVEKKEIIVERQPTAEKKSLFAFLSRKKSEAAVVEAKPAEEPAKQLAEDKGIFSFMAKEAPSGPEQAKSQESQIEAPKFDEHQERYMRRRGQMMEQAKVDMLRKQEPVAPLTDAAEEASLPEETETSDLELEKGLDLTDLESVSDLSELSGMDLSGESDLSDLDMESDNLAGLSKIMEVPKEKGMGCPHCNSTKSMIVYCPYCGKGLCSNCADKVRNEGSLTFYTCPTCKKEVIVKK